MILHPGPNRRAADADSIIYRHGKRNVQLVYASQMAQTNHALSTVRTTQSKSASDIKSLSGRLSTAENQLVLIAPYSQVCSTDLEGQNGPTRFFFACSTRQPGSGS